MTIQDQINKILKKGKYEYGTPEYWEKERRSKFIINARQKEEIEERFQNAIINLWSLTTKIEMPLYQMFK